MMGDPIIGLVATLFGMLVTAAIIGFLLFQFSFKAIWCFIISETAVLTFYTIAVHSTDRFFSMLPDIHLFRLTPLLAASFGAYCFNWFVIADGEDGTS